MKLSILAGSTSQSINIFIADSSSTTGAGLTGLVYNSAGLSAYYSHAGANATATAITLATLATVTTAYSSGGFKEIDSTNMPGWYRFDLPNAVLATSKGRSVAVHLKGATNMAPLPIEIELTGWDNQDSVRGGLTAFPNVASGSAGALLVDGTGTAAISTSGGRAKADVAYWNAAAVATPDTAGYPKVTGKSGTGTGEWNLASGVIDANVTKYGGTAGTFSTGRPEVNTTHLAGTSQTARDIGASVLLSSGTGTGQVSLNSGAVTLHTSQPALTFTSITCTGAWTVSDGIIVTCSTSGRSAVDLTGNGTGHGILVKSGTGASGNAIYAMAQSTNGHGVLGSGAGVGNGIYGYGGPATGNGIKGQGGDTSGYGLECTSVNSSAIHAAPTTSGHGFEITAAGTNKDAIKLTPGSGGYGINGTALSVVTVTGNVNGNVGGNVTGSVGSVTGNVGGNVVGSVASVAGAVGSVTGSVGSISTGGITSSSFAASSITAASLATDAGTELATALLDLSDGVETSITVRQAIRAMASMLVGTVSGGGTGTEVFKSIGGSTTRVTATVESDGDRTGMSLNL